MPKNFYFELCISCLNELFVIPFNGLSSGCDSIFFGNTAPGTLCLPIFVTSK